jgi:hypothetical protein
VLKAAYVGAFRFELPDPFGEPGKLVLRSAQDMPVVWIGAQKQKYFVVANESFRIQKF